MRHRTLIIIILSLLLVGGTTAWKYTPHSLSYDECSEVYRHFVDMQMEGVRVTYVRDKVVNDTLRLPVTLLQAENDAGWKTLDSVFERTRQVEEILVGLPDSVTREFLEMPFSFYTYRAHRDTPETKAQADDLRSDDIFVYIFLNLRCVTIYEPTDPRNERDAIISRSIESQKEME